MKQHTNIARHGTAALMAVLLAFPSAAFQASGGSAVVTVLTSVHNIDSNGDGIDDAAAAHLGLDVDALDSNGDGVPDWWLLRHGLDPLDPHIADRDLNGGGLTVRDEYAYGTSPWHRDTTGNGWWDSFEVAWGSDPADPNDAPFSTIQGDLNADGRVDASDVQLVINAALGMAVPVPAKVSGAGPVNATDVQIVINAALGL